jgi:SPP1 gp7 family putative phage head morphogenesis protein
MQRKRRPTKRIPRQPQPDRIRERYFARVRERVLVPARALLERRIYPALPGLLARMDGVNDDMDRAAEEFFKSVLRPGDVEDIVRDIAGRTEDWQKQELGKQLEASVGVDVLGAEPGLSKRAEAFTNENVALIKSVPSAYFDQVEKLITRAMSAGMRHEELAKLLADRFSVAESSARLIARDQVGKYMGDLNRTRQTALGITHYIWRTVNDGRVREEHEELEGERFSWDDAPSEGHPGYAINCRCYAEPDLSTLLGEDAPEQERAPAEEPAEVAPPPPPEPVPAAPPSTPVQTILSEAETNAARLERELLAAVRRGDITPEQLARARDRLDNPLTINFLTEHLPEIVEAGRFKSAAEMTTREGALGSAQERIAAERAVFGPAIDTMAPQDFPVTAALNANNDPRGGASLFGDSHFVLRDSVRDRATMTPADSGGSGAATRGKTVPARNPDGLILERPELRAKGPMPLSYIEAQIFGGVRIEDIAELHVDSREMTPEVESAARRMQAAGVKVFVHDRTGDADKVTEL